MYLQPSSFQLHASSLGFLWGSVTSDPSCPRSHGGQLALFRLLKLDAPGPLHMLLSKSRASFLPCLPDKHSFSKRTVPAPALWGCLFVRRTETRDLYFAECCQRKCQRNHDDQHPGWPRPFSFWQQKSHVPGTGWLPLISQGLREGRPRR